jgi:hypothetical protein
MIDNPFAPIKPDRVPENPFAPPKPDDEGKLTPERWQFINLLMGRTNKHDKLIADFGRMWGVSRRRLKAEIQTYRLASPPMLQ